jgi:PAS domain S-box-containing protein
MEKDCKPVAQNGRKIAPGEADNARLLHELQVYEVELEQQNDELRQTRKHLEIAVDRYTNLFDFAPVGYFTLKSDGTIAQVNLAGTRLLAMTRQQLGGELLRNFVAADFRADFDRLISIAILSDESRICELAMLRADAAPLFVHIEAWLNDAGDEFMLVLVDITEHQQAVASLQAANAQLVGLAEERAAHLQILSDELTQTEQRERDRLYELLHDNVQPLLVATRLGLSGLSEQTPQEHMLWAVGEANEQISKVIQTARTLSIELSPPLIRERGLIPALESLCRWMQSNYGLQVDMDFAPETEPASMTIRLLCFKAVRELLMNVVKYAGTHHAVVDLEREPDNMLRITVRDDGIGFDPAEIIGSGLANIERRLGMAGGRLSVESAPNSGTIATILTPLDIGAAEKRIATVARALAIAGKR